MQRRTVRGMSGFGIPHEQIATYIGIDAKTLRKHYRDDLDRGMIEATVKVAQTLFTMATVDKNVAAAIFFLKCRANWREKAEVTHQFVGSDGQTFDPRPSPESFLSEWKAKGSLEGADDGGR
jgi:hypothetical protein